MYKRSKLKRITINVLMVVLLVIGLGLIFNNQIRSYMLSQRSKQYNLTNFTQEKLEENLKKSGNFDFDSVESISNELVLKAQFDNTELPVIGGINVPSVNISLPVLKGLDNNSLLTGAGTMKPEQVLGEGNYSLASHSTVDKSLLFSPLEYISLNDSIYLTDLQKIYTYNVTLKEKVDPSRIEFIEDVPNRKLVTLVTCGDLAVITRLIVQGELTKVTNFSDADYEIQSLFV